MRDTGTQISTVDGNVTLVGYGGTVTNTPNFADTRGVRTEPGTIIQATGAGSISIIPPYKNIGQ